MTEKSSQTGLAYAWPKPGFERAAGLVLVASMGALVLVGCSQPRRAASQPAAWLEIVRPIVIPAASAHVDLQDGGPVGGLDRTRLYCSLEVDTVSEEPQSVPPQRLAVRRVQRRILADEQANIPAFVPWTFSCSGDRYYRVRMDLAGERAPRVRNLTCTEWYSSCDLGDYATLDQIEQTVGSGIRWHTAEQSIEPGRWDGKPGDYQ
jgi:hypothetical protein